MRAGHVAAQRGRGATAMWLQAQPLLEAIQALQRNVHTAMEQNARIEFTWVGVCLRAPTGWQTGNANTAGMHGFCLGMHM